MKKLPYILLLILVLMALVYGATKLFRINPSIKILAPDYSGQLPIDRLQVPDGFEVGVFAEGITGARSLAVSPSGTVFVGTRDDSKVYALQDRDGDMVAETKYIIWEEGHMPNGVAFRNGDLYVAEVSRIVVFRDIERNLENPGAPEVIRADYPTDTHHGWKYIAFGPDDKLYVPVGAPCNICESDSIYASITRINPDGGDREIVQYGIRNTVGFTWHPETGDLWLTDNGRDMMGDDLPACELNCAPQDGLHFGYPYCHQGDVLDPQFGKGKDCSDYTAPALNLGAHVAPLGIEIYQGDQFPQEYHHKAIWAEHGSWNRSKKAGYRVMMTDLLADGQTSEYQQLITGWLNHSTQEVWGRPVDIAHLSDGSLLISDDFADAIYRLYFAGDK